MRAAGQHLVHIGAQIRDRRVQPLALALGVLRDQPLDRHARLVQHRRADGETFGEHRALEAIGPVAPDARFFEQALVDEFARAHHFGKHHGDGLQRLGLFLVVVPPRAVLHDENAERAPAAQDRNAEKRLIRVFARFRTVREVRMLRRVGEIERPRVERDVADETFAFFIRVLWTAEGLRPSVAKSSSSAPGRIR